MSKPHPAKILSLHTMLPFGKYKHFHVSDVIENDPKWLMWAIDEQMLELDNEAYSTLQTKLKQQ